MLNRKKSTMHFMVICAILCTQLHDSSFYYNSLVIFLLNVEVCCCVFSLTCLSWDWVFIVFRCNIHLHHLFTWEKEKIGILFWIMVNLTHKLIRKSRDHFQSVGGIPVLANVKGKTVINSRWTWRSSWVC